MSLGTSAEGDRSFEVRLQPLGGPDELLALFVATAPASDTSDEIVERLVAGAERLAGVVTEALYVLRVEDDLRLVLTWADPRLEELTGYTYSELAALGGLTALVVTEDRSELRHRNQALLGGTAGLATYRLRERSGTVRRVRDSARPIVNADDRLVLGVVGGLADAEQPQADEVLSAQARIAEVLGAQLHQLACLVDDRGTICWAGTAPATPLAHAIGALVGADVETVLPPGLVDEWLALVDEAFASSEEAAARFDWPLGKGSEAVEVTMARFDRGRAIALFRPAEITTVDGQRATPTPPQPRLPLDLLAGLGLPLLVLSPSGRVEGATEPLIKHLRLPLENMAGRSLLDEAAGAANRARLEAAVAAVLAAPGSPIEAELSLDADRWPVPEFRIQLAALERPEGGMWLLGMLLEPREASTPHGPSRPDGAPLEMILEGLSEAVVTVDAAGVVEWASGAAELMLGRRGETLVGQPIEPLFERAEDDGRRLLESLVSEGPASAAAPALRARRTTGELFPVEVTGRAFGKGRRRFALVIRDLTLRAHTEETLARLAYHDTLTGLPNRILFHDRLAQAVERGRRTRQMFAVMLVGLDRFKIINDSLGLERGDQVLKVVAERLAQAVRSSDTVARLGGDEFLLLLAGIELAGSVAKVAQKLLVALRPPLAVGGHELTVAASIGIALFPHDGDTPEALIKNADTALSRAKEQGRSHFQFYTTDMNATAIERLMLESRLRRALENGDFVVYYQPQASLETGAIVGVEALIRWIDPALGVVPPSDFIPVAEETGLIVEIGSWVLRTAAAEMARWHRRLGRTDLRLAVNLSGRQFQQADLVEMVGRTLAETGLRPSSLELEITESVVMREATASVRRLKELTGLGVHLAIDDFGTGYSSLSYLRTFPIRSLKIDRTFILDIDRDPNSATLAQGVVGLGRSLGLKLVAEGVETVRQLRLLKSYGCQEMQGFLLSRPLPSEEALAMLEQGHTLADVAE